jgi:hypothetical protein
METVELRVHGVHGTSPGAMLGVDDAAVGQVAGDGLTGIYRARDGQLPLRELGGTDVSVEAYSWGSLTSGVQGFLGWVKRALWLLLLPFALVNLAYWARIGLAQGTGQSRWGARAVRVSGLLLTVFFVVVPCVVAIDMAAWQCYRYGVPGCSVVPGWLNFVAGLAPGRRIALATLVPVAVVTVLWLLSKTSIRRYESVHIPSSDPASSTPTAAEWGGQVLRHPHLWDGSQRTLRLQRFHLAAALATVIAFSGFHVLVAGQGRLVGWSVLALLVSLLLAVALMAVAVVAVCANHPDDVEWGLDDGGPGSSPSRLDQLGEVLGRRFDTAVSRGAVGALAFHVLVLWTLDTNSRHLDESLDFVGRNVWFVALFVLLTVLHLSIFTGGRMSAPAASAVSLSPLLVVVVPLAQRQSGVFDQRAGWVILVMTLAAIAFWAALATWQYRHPRQGAEAMAWRGAGSSVLLATAAWVALLFASSTVVAAANWLNGSDSGVGDLVSRVEVPLGAVAPTTLDLGSEGSTRNFVGTGNIVLRGARVTLAGDRAVVSAGTVRMKGLSLEVDSDYSGTDAFTEGRGRTVVDRRSSHLWVPAQALVLEDSCLAAGPSRCSAEDDEFHSAGVLTLPEGVRQLELARGVVLDPTDDPEVPLAVPQVLIWTAIGQFAWLLLVGAALGICMVRFSRGAGRAIRRHYSGVDRWLEAVPHDRRDGCTSARTKAALAHRAETLLDVVGAVTSPVALIVVVVSASGIPPWGMPHLGWTRSVATVSMWLVVGMSAGLILLGSQIRRSEKARKAVGVIWDLTTFWPRAAHPLAPPCYAERVVPELEVRSRWVLEKPSDSAYRGNLLILSGHSQGSLIVLSTLARIDAMHLPRTRVVTYGSQIRALYGRVFPRVFGPDIVGYEATQGMPSLTDAVPDLPADDARLRPPGPPPEDSVRARLSGAGSEWVNLFRRTDPLGWRVFSDVDSDLDRPVPEVPPVSSGDPGPMVMGHSGYQHSAIYRRVIAGWTGEPFVEEPPGTKDLPTLPRL